MNGRIVAFVTVFVFLLALTSCGGNTAENTTDETESSEVQTTESVELQESTETVTVAEATEAVQTTEAVTQPENTTQVQTSEIVTEAVTDAETTEAVSEDVASWNTEKIVAFYKEAAAATGNSVKSQQTIGLQDISVNNGQLSGVFSFVTPILSSFLSGSTTETDGITGEFLQLTAEDVSTARAYESSKGTVVEITLNEQTDKADADVTDGSVAHGISVVADLPSVMAQLNERGLPIDISAQNTVLKYTDPVIKAVISDDGKIVNGTWSCIVEISLSDYKFAGSAVDSTSVVLDNKITVNGGFAP